MRLVLLLLLTILPALAAGPPNIVFILADDMGYGDVRALNPQSKIPTPNIDSLARDGVTFTDAHTGSAVCTPTRYGLVTGRYAWRTRLKRGVLNGYGEPLIAPDRLTVAGFLGKHGYYTGVVGKWHLGLGFARNGEEFDFSKPVTDHPNTHGFDYSYIIPASLDFPPYVYIHDGKLTAFPSITQPAQEFPAFLREGPRAPDLVMEDCLDHLLKQATAFIGRRAGEQQPFLLYFALTAPHKPALPHPHFRGRTELGPYGDFVAQVDWTVGQVLEAIENAGIKDNTLVIYTSDNGSYMYRYDEPDAADHVSDETIQGYRPGHHTANGTLRGTKADIWEAGHRVPFFARWPGLIKPGSRTAETICLTDFYATTADILNQPLPADAAEDSFSFLPILEGKPRITPRAPVIHHSANGVFAIRERKWKLVLANGSGGRAEPKSEPFEKPYHLYDMETDRSERSNQIAQHPDIAARLEEAVQNIRDAGRSR